MAARSVVTSSAASRPPERGQRPLAGAASAARDGTGAAASTRQSTSAMAWAPVSCRAPSSMASRTGVAASTSESSQGSTSRGKRACHFLSSSSPAAFSTAKARAPSLAG